MERKKWFATPIWHEYSNIDTNKIAKTCLRFMESGFPNRKFSNVGGWQSEDLNLKEHKDFDELVVYINKCLTNIASEVDPKFKLTLTNAWININPKGTWNRRHAHPCSVISGVFYVATDGNTGNIIFDSGSASKHYSMKTFNSDMFLKSAVYHPSDGMIVFFPSWIEHEVSVNNSDKRRISIAFNADQIY